MNLARKIAEAIESDLNDRSGFDLGALDDDIHDEILEAWEAIIAEHIKELEEYKGMYEGLCK